MRRVVKRALDVVVSLATLTVLSPLLLVIAIVARVMLGRPILFHQVRLGYRGEPFVLYKFRTMRELRGDEEAPASDAHRITRLGRFLRRSSLDELPQLFNVLSGSMSLVGPRPLLPEYRDRYTAHQWRRHEVPPGIAGAVQALGRNSLSWEQKFDLDVWYVDNWSLRLDLKLLAKSFGKVLSGEGLSAQGHATMPRFEGNARMRESKDDGS
jgi:sugar transferase EpsL